MLEDERAFDGAPGLAAVQFDASAAGATGGFGGASPNVVQIRKDFPETWIWAEAVTSNHK